MGRRHGAADAYAMAKAHPSLMLVMSAGDVVPVPNAIPPNKRGIYQDAYRAAAEDVLFDLRNEHNETPDREENHD